MNAGEAFWNDRWNLFEKLYEKSIPTCLNAAPYVRASVVSSGLDRSGVLFRTNIINKYMPIKPFNEQWRSSMETAIAATESTERAVAAVDKLQATVDAFRKDLKNDLVSMKATSQRIQDETARIRERYLAAQEVLTNPNFERAINNAERMVAALSALSELSAMGLNVSVLAAPGQKEG